MYAKPFVMEMCCNIVQSALTDRVEKQFVDFVGTASQVDDQYVLDGPHHAPKVFVAQAAERELLLKRGHGVISDPKKKT